MGIVKNNKPLTFRTVKTIKLEDKINADKEESAGLRVECGTQG